VECTFLEGGNTTPEQYFYKYMGEQKNKLWGNLMIHTSTSFIVWGTIIEDSKFKLKPKMKPNCFFSITFGRKTNNFREKIRIYDYGKKNIHEMKK